MQERHPIARITRARANARVRAERLRAIVPALAERLYRIGATRVVLFGSLAPSGTPHEESDVDLCVEGLDDDALADVILDLVELVGCDVDLVRWEAASPPLRRRITSEGVEVSRVPG